MFITRVVRGQHLHQTGGSPVMEIGRGAPDFDERRRVEFHLLFTSLAGAHVVLAEIGVVAAGMARGAVGFRVNGFAALGLRRSRRIRRRDAKR